jgi:hypothetical protein
VPFFQSNFVWVVCWGIVNFMFDLYVRNWHFGIVADLSFSDIFASSVLFGWLVVFFLVRLTEESLNHSFCLLPDWDVWKCCLIFVCVFWYCQFLDSYFSSWNCL